MSSKMKLGEGRTTDHAKGLNDGEGGGCPESNPSSTFHQTFAYVPSLTSITKDAISVANGACEGSIREILACDGSIREVIAR